MTTIWREALCDAKRVIASHCAFRVILNTQQYTNHAFPYSPPASSCHLVFNQRQQSTKDRKLHHYILFNAFFFFFIYIPIHLPQAWFHLCLYPSQMLCATFCMMWISCSIISPNNSLGGGGGGTKI